MSEPCPIWEHWVSLNQMKFGQRTGRLLGFYRGRHYVALDIQAGAIAGVQTSDRELRIEQMVVRLALVKPELLRQGFHLQSGQLEPDKKSIVPFLLRNRVLDRRDLSHAREQQMIAILRTLLTAPDATFSFVDLPAVTPTIETAVRADAALSTAYAEAPLVHARSRRKQTPNVSLLFGRGQELPKAEPKSLTNRRIRTV